MRGGWAITRLCLAFVAFWLPSLWLPSSWSRSSCCEAQDKGYREYYQDVGGYLSEGRYVRARAISDHLLSQLDERRVWWPRFLLLGAEVRARQGEVGSAHELLDRLLQNLTDRNDDEELRCEAYGIRGDLYLAEGRVDLAAPSIEQNGTRSRLLLETAEREGIDSAVLVPARARVIGANARVVRLELARGRHDDAITSVDRFLGEEVLYPLGSSERAGLTLLRGLAEEQLGLSSIGSLARERESASATLMKALGGLARLPLASARLALGRLELDRGDVGAARAHLAAAQAVADDFGSPSDVVPLAIEEELSALSARILMAVSTAADGGSVRDDWRSARNRLESVIERRLAHWSSMPARSGGRGVLHYRERRAPLGELIPFLVAMEGPIAGARSALELLFRVQTQGTLAVREEASAPTVDDVVESLLGPGDGLLVYLVVARRSHVIALDRDGPIAAVAAGMHQIVEARRAYLSHFSAVVASAVVASTVAGSEGSSGWAIERERKLAKRLGETLLPPEIAERISQWKSTAIVGLDPVGRVPFEWLPAGDEPYLGLRSAVYHIPNIPFVVARSRSRRQSDSANYEREYVLIGGSGISDAVAQKWPELDPLPLSADIADGLLRNYRPGRSELIAAEAATVSRMLSEDLSRVGTLQFLVHTVYDGSMDRPVSLVLSPGRPSDKRGMDGLLGSDEVESSSAPRCVLMASCRSGIGPDRRGDAGSADLMGAWLSAGSDAVLASQSDLRYGPTIEITGMIQRFLRRDGVGLAEALRRSLVNVVEEYGESAPFRAGLMHVSGLGRRPVFSGDLYDPGPLPRTGPGIWPRRFRAMGSRYAWLLVLLAVVGTGWYVRRSIRAGERP